MRHFRIVYSVVAAIGTIYTLFQMVRSVATGNVMNIAGIELNSEAMFHLYGWLTVLGISVLVFLNAWWIPRFIRRKEYHFKALGDDLLDLLDRTRAQIEADKSGQDYKDGLADWMRREIVRDKLRQADLRCPRPHEDLETWEEFLSMAAVAIEHDSYGWAKQLFNSLKLGECEYEDDDEDLEQLPHTHSGAPPREGEVPDTKEAHHNPSSATRG